jgi:PadR family transcriptional regulator PadR
MNGGIGLMGFQITAALLDACVLSMLEREDAYGYMLTQNLRERLQVSESTLYPVLRRLQKEDCLRTYDMPYQGRNRRYYSITDSGRIKLTEYRRDWNEYRDRLDTLLENGGNANG